MINKEDEGIFRFDSNLSMERSHHWGDRTASFLGVDTQLATFKDFIDNAVCDPKVEINNSQSTLRNPSPMKDHRFS